MAPVRRDCIKTVAEQPSLRCHACFKTGAVSSEPAPRVCSEKSTGENRTSGNIVYSWPPLHDSHTWGSKAVPQ